MSSRDVYEKGFDESTGKTIEAEACPECEGRLVTEGGEILCTECGLIVEEYRIDHGPESSFGDEERTGAPLTPSRHDRGLSTVIGRGSDAKGNGLSGRKHRQLARLRREHTRATMGSKTEQNLAHGCAQIARMTDALGLSRSIRDRASTLFRQAQDEELLRGRSIESMASASVYAACRCGGYVRTLGEVVSVARCEESRILNAYRVLNVELGLEVAPRKPQEFLPRFASELGVPERVRRRAQELMVTAENEEIGLNCNPRGVTAACLYLAAEEHSWPLTQADCGEAANVTPVTVRSRYQELKRAVD